MDRNYDSVLSADELRLLLPVEIRHDRLSFKMLSFPRLISPSYTAISYTWGDGNPNDIIHLNDNPFPVRRNLWSCLYHISSFLLDSHSPCQLLWVDAICINQRSNEERNSQVCRMDTTYRDAQSVSVWLGLPPLPSEYGSPAMYDHIRTLEVDSSFDWITCLHDLANRPYWKRFWVIQEFLLGREVNIFCGNTTMPWEMFKDLFQTQANVNIWQGNVSALGAVSEEWAALPLVMGRHVDKHPEFHQPLYRLLIDHCDSMCKDPRDRVFALLGLVTYEEKAALQRFLLDYGMSKSDVAIIALSHVKTFNLEWDGEDADRLYKGLGISNASELKKLYKRVERFDYLGDIPPRPEIWSESYDGERLTSIPMPDRSEEVVPSRTSRRWLLISLPWLLIVGGIVFIRYNGYSLN